MIGFNVSSDFANMGQVQLRVRQIRIATLENAFKVLMAKMPPRVYNHKPIGGRVGTLNLVA